MQSRRANPIDFARSIASFCIVWNHSQYYWTLDLENRHIVDIAKFYAISWAMPFFYISAFYFIIRYGIRNTPTNKVFWKMGTIFKIQISVIIIYGIYRSSINLVLDNYSLKSGISLLFSDLSLGSAFRVFSSGNTTPAYFLGQLFFLYFPLFLLGRLLLMGKYISLIAITSLFTLYFLNVENSFITKESYVYLAIAISLFKINPKQICDNLVHRVLLCLSLLFLIVWRLHHHEFLLICLAIWGIYAFLRRGGKTNWIVEKLSSFGYSYSLFIFLFHSLFLSIIELLLTQMSVDLFSYNYGQIVTYSLINILAFGCAAIFAILLNRRFGWILKL
jgi:hypothetical protein